MPQHELAQAGTERKAKARADGFREQIVTILPGLSAFAYCLTGNEEQRDDLVQEICAYALAHKDQWQPGMHLISTRQLMARGNFGGATTAAPIRG